MRAKNVRRPCQILHRNVVSQSNPANLPVTLSLAEEDRRRQRIESELHAADLDALKNLWHRNRSAALDARQEGDMAAVVGLVRGAKTIQRIANARGLVLSVKRQPRSRPTGSGEG